MARTGRAQVDRPPWRGASVTASIAVAIVGISTFLSAHQTSAPQPTQPPGLIAHYPLATGSLFEANRMQAPLIVRGADFHAGRGIFCNGEYVLNWPDGCNIHTPLLNGLDLSSFTISAQFLVPSRAPILSQPVFVLGRNRLLAFTLLPEGRIELRTNSTVRTDCSVRYRTGHWHEATVTFDAETAILYLDGTAGCRAKDLLLKPLVLADRMIMLTNYGDATAYYGFLRELRVQNGAVTPERKRPVADDVPAPEPAYIPPVDRFLATCPTAAQLSAIDRDLRVEFDVDPTAREPLACRSSEGSRNLSPAKRRVYNTLLLMQRIEFDRPLPWTTASLYQWLTSAIRGIRFRADIKNSFCCNPARVINLNIGPAVAGRVSTDRWVEPAQGADVGLNGLMLIIAHEARHTESGPHTCGTNDRTLEELGSWAVHYYLMRWLADHTDQAFFSSGPRNYNARLKDRADTILKRQICGK